MKNLPVVLFGGLLLGGCDTKACTQIGCIDAVDVAFGGEDGRAAGGYLIRVEADDLKTECEVTLGDDDGLGGGAGLGGSGGRIGVVANCSGDLGLAVEVLGTDRIEGLKIHGVWERVSIELSRDGDVLLDDSFKPNYAEVRPNGEGCNPVCSVAQHDAAFDGMP